jgi:hypothetical protein
MSRDPKRIPKVLAALGELWQEHPDLRLGQIIGNASITFYTEDDQAEKSLTEWRDYYRENRRTWQS